MTVGGTLDTAKKRGISSSWLPSDLLLLLAFPFKLNSLPSFTELPHPQLPVACCKLSPLDSTQETGL